MKPFLYPICLRPAYQTYIWGGRRLETHFARTDLPAGVVAESWEVSDRPEGLSLVENGPWAGKSLVDLVNAGGANLLGTSLPDQDRFPLLIKILDAQQVLSVQVHPNDESARQFGGEAKTEMWYVLAATREARVYCGLKTGTDAEAVRRAIRSENLQDLLVSIPVKAGDVIHVPGGQVHAIDAGCLLLEVQQNSNTTYRLYDWGRVGDDGKPRDLHVEKALDVINFEVAESARVKPVLRELRGPITHELLSTPYFYLESMKLDGPVAWPVDPKSFEVIFVESGTVDIRSNDETVQRSAGTSCLLPAGLLDVNVTPLGEPPSRGKTDSETRHRVATDSKAKIVRIRLP